MYGTANGCARKSQHAEVLTPPLAPHPLPGEALSAPPCAAHVSWLRPVLMLPDPHHLLPITRLFRRLEPVLPWTKPPSSHHSLLACHAAMLPAAGLGVQRRRSSLYSGSSAPATEPPAAQLLLTSPPAASCTPVPQAHTAPASSQSVLGADTGRTASCRCCKGLRSPEGRPEAHAAARRSNAWLLRPACTSRTAPPLAPPGRRTCNPRRSCKACCCRQRKDHAQKFALPPRCGSRHLGSRCLPLLLDGRCGTSGCCRSQTSACCCSRYWCSLCCCSCRWHRC